jgi:pimeloyl-ACP methyl ester carboxylesterase
LILLDKKVKIGSCRVNTRSIGEIAGAPSVIVFLHEALGSILQWKSFPETLCAALGMPGIIIERRGHGGSDPLPDIPRTARYLHDYTLETKKTLDELLPAETKIVIVGHSDGGTIALLYARHFPKNLLAICTMAAHTFVEPETLAGIGPAVNAYQAGKLDGLKRIHGDKTDRLFYAWADTWRAGSFSSWDIREEIKGILCPVLALQGTNDQYGTAAQLDSIAGAGNNVRTVLIPDCGHHPHIEAGPVVIKAIAEWL